MQHLNVIPREQLCGQIGVSRSTIKRWNETRNFPAISSGLGLLMAIYGPPFPNYMGGHFKGAQLEPVMGIQVH